MPDQRRASRRQAAEPVPVALALDGDVRVVVEGDDAGRLRRAGHHHPDVLAHLLEVADEIGVAGVEADPDAGQVRALRQRVHGDDAVEAVLAGSSPAAAPRELDVALVGEHRHVVAPAPGGGGGEVVEAPVGLLGLLTHSASARSASSSAIASRSRRPASSAARHRPAPGEDRAHLVGRVGRRRVQHGVAVGAAQAQPLRQRADELLGPDRTPPT